MITFSDLIKNNVAPSPYKFDVITSSSDRFLINYNNIWGIVTDTRMSIGEDGNYYITGSLIKNERKTNDLVYSWTWGDYNFNDSSLGISTLFEYCKRNHKTIHHEIVNGDDVLVVKNYTQEQEEYCNKNSCNCVNPYPFGACDCSDDTSKKEEEIINSLNFKY
jgi:hypothetical protein